MGFVPPGRHVTPDPRTAAAEHAVSARARDLRPGSEPYPTDSPGPGQHGGVGRETERENLDTPTTLVRIRHVHLCVVYGFPRDRAQG